MKIIIEKGDKPELIALVRSLRSCGINLDIRSTEHSSLRHSVRDEDVKAAIIKVMPSFSVSTQWCAIYRVLVDYCGYPEEMTSFCEKIDKLMNGVNLPYPCKYQSIQKIVSARAIFQKRLDKWTEFNSNETDRVFYRQQKTAYMLLDYLGIK